MKQFLLAAGMSLAIVDSITASPGNYSDRFGRNEFFQDKPITGKVTNDKGEPLVGVTVQIKGLRTSTTTNADGVFTIDAPAGSATLVFSYVGTARKEVSIAGKTDFQIQLASADATLDDVVVVGYGTQKKGHLTGAIETIKTKEIEDLPVGNLGAALSGRVLGLAVSGGTARPGSTPNLTIRNPVTLSKDGGTLDPLYVIDGIIQVSADGRNDPTQFNNLDPSEVESISVLKDATAAIYGSRGAQGVILVTTKRGKSGAPKITYSGSYGINDESYRTKMMSAYEFAMYMNIMNGPNGAKKVATDVESFFSQDELDHFKSINYDWLEPAWKSSHTMRHTLNVSGGSDRATYFASASYYSQNGNLSSLDYKKYTFRAGSDVKVANNLKAGLQVTGNYSDRIKTFNKIGSENDENDYRNLLLAPRYIPMYVDDYPVKIPGTDALSGYHFYEIERLQNLAQTKDKAMGVNIYLEYELPFIKGLKARGTYARYFSGSNASQVGTSYRLYEFNRTGANAHIYDDGATVKLPGTIYKNGDRLYYSNTTAENTQMNFTLNYARQFGRHNVSALASVEKAEASSNQEDVWKESPVLSTNGQFGSAFGAIDGRTSGSESGALGYIGRANYSYADKYLVEFLFRTDASTHFAPENYWGSFYSGSAGWVVSNEDFFNVKAIDFLKIRYSVGMLGKDDTKAWQWRQRYTYQNGKGAVFGGNTNASTGMKMEASPNRDATWSNEFKNNLGIDARFLRNRLSVTLEGFYNKGTDLLIERTESVPITIGGTVAAENWGEMDFFGYEVGFDWKDNLGKDFTYGIGARFSWYDNKWSQGNFAATDVYYPWKKQIGQSDDNGTWGYDYLGMFKTQEEVDAYISKSNIKEVFTTPAANLRPGMLYYRDVRGALQPDGTFAGPDGIIDENDQVQLSKKSNNHYGIGVTVRAGYKGFALDFVIAGSFGGWSEIDGNSRKKMNNIISRNFQSKPAYWGNIYDPVLNPTGTMPNPNWDNVSLSPTSDFWKVSGFRMGMRNANLNYTVPKRIAESLRLSNARISLTALNPLNFYNPFDYKAPDGAYDVFPNLRTFSVGLNVTF
jgi:TonB-linked SusC/RagA family outer membrane protein